MEILAVAVVYKQENDKDDKLLSGIKRGYMIPKEHFHFLMLFITNDWLFDCVMIDFYYVLQYF